MQQQNLKAKKDVSQESLPKIDVQRKKIKPIKRYPLLFSHTYVCIVVFLNSIPKYNESKGFKPEFGSLMGLNFTRWDKKIFWISSHKETCKRSVSRGQKKERSFLIWQESSRSWTPYLYILAGKSKMILKIYLVGNRWIMLNSRNLDTIWAGAFKAPFTWKTSLWAWASKEIELDQT